MPDYINQGQLMVQRTLTLSDNAFDTVMAMMFLGFICDEMFSGLLENRDMIASSSAAFSLLYV